MAIGALIVRIKRYTSKLLNVIRCDKISKMT